MNRGSRSDDSETTGFSGGGRPPGWLDPAPRRRGCAVEEVEGRDAPAFVGRSSADEHATLFHFSLWLLFFCSLRLALNFPDFKKSAV